jgi:hypothetical protein
MEKSKSKRKKRSDKFAITLHKTARFCKKIKGKLYYFRTDKRRALAGYLGQAVYLRAGRPPKPDARRYHLSIKVLCYLYLDHQQSRTEIGEINSRHEGRSSPRQDRY